MRSVRSLMAALAVAGIAACELSDVELTGPEELVIVQIYAEVGDGPNRAYGFLQGTLSSAAPTSGARIELTTEAGTVELAEVQDTRLCNDEATDPLVDGSCYVADPLPEGFANPGTSIEARVVLPEGGVLRGTSTVPDRIDLLTPELESVACRIEPDTVLEVTWTRSPGAWAYVGETQVFGLGPVLEARDITAEIDDPLFLRGLAISDADTVLTFPSEFGVFDRFDLDRDVAVLLQEGLPAGTSASVTVAAVDRNVVNWLRGGSFNPSGSVRVPSLRGDGGSGVIGTYFRRTFRVTTEPEADVASCR